MYIVLINRQLDLRLREWKNPMEVIYGSAIDVGVKRRGKPNQDSLVVLMPPASASKPPVFVVADGMGGYTGGEVASQIVVKQFENQYKNWQGKTFSLASFADSVFSAAIGEMKKKAEADAQFGSMGSTVVAVSLEAGRINVVNVGDSRAYIINTNRIRQINHDHSYVGEMMRAGLLNAEEAMTHPKKNQLTQSIRAQAAELKPYYSTELFGADDIVLLCSDGLWGCVPEMLIQFIVLENPLQKAAELLVQTANEHGGPDNISVILARPNKDAPITKPSPRAQNADTSSTLVQHR